MVEVANDYRDITFAIADEEQYSDRLKDFGLDDSGEDVNVGLLDEKDRKYKMDDEFSEDSLRDFLDSYKNGQYYMQFSLYAINLGKMHINKVYKKGVFRNQLYCYNLNAWSTFLYIHGRLFKHCTAHLLCDTLACLMLIRAVISVGRTVKGY